VAAESEVDNAIRTLEVELRKLEVEYNSFFAGRLPRPPWEMRSRVELLFKQLDRATSQNRSYSDRFRFQSLQSRYATFADLWDRGLKAREEGRPGPFSSPRRPRGSATEPAGDRILHVTVFVDPLKEMEKLQELYERLKEARTEMGEPQIPFHRFAGLVREQVANLKLQGAPEVIFRLAMRHGKVNFTARALRGSAKGKT
jgi:hypothetical protein